MFIDLSAFLGEKSEFYEGIDVFMRKEMTPQNVLPKVAETIAVDYIPATQTIINFGQNHQFWKVNDSPRRFSS